MLINAGSAREAGSTALALWAIAIPSIATICSVFLSASCAVHDPNTNPWKVVWTRVVLWRKFRGLAQQFLAFAVYISLIHDDLSLLVCRILASNVSSSDKTRAAGKRLFRNASMNRGESPSS